MYYYDAYNLRLRSDLMLPELITADTGADVAINFGSVEIPDGADKIGPHYYATSDEICFLEEGIGWFLVRDGRQIVVDPVVGVQPRVLRQSVLGPALGALMHQRGRLVLHASSVVVGGEAVVFLGGAGSGKSTIAAAFAMQGHTLVSDDFTSIEFDHGVPIVSPGYPQLTLYPDAVVAVGQAPRLLPRIHTTLDKRALRVGDHFSQQTFPLRRLYVLDGDASFDTEQMAPQDALLELVRHSYASHLLQATGMGGLHLRQCAAIVSSIVTRSLRTHSSLMTLAGMVRAVEADLEECSQMSMHNSRVAACAVDGVVMVMT